MWGIKRGWPAGLLVLIGAALGFIYSGRVGKGLVYELSGGAAGAVLAFLIITLMGAALGWTIGFLFQLLGPGQSATDKDRTWGVPKAETAVDRRARALRVLERLIVMTYEVRREAEAFAAAHGAAFMPGGLPKLRNAARIYRDASRAVDTPVLTSDATWEFFEDRQDRWAINDLRERWVELFAKQQAYLEVLLQWKSGEDAARGTRAIQEHELAMKEMLHSQQVVQNRFGISREDLAEVAQRKVPP